MDARTLRFVVGCTLRNAGSLIVLVVLVFAALLAMSLLLMLAAWVCGV